MPFGQLAETTHFHLFTMPVVFLIMVHVLYLTMASPMIKALSTWLAFLGVTFDLVSPWLISYVSPLFVLLLLTGDILMLYQFLDHVCDPHVRNVVSQGATHDERR